MPRVGQRIFATIPRIAAVTGLTLGLAGCFDIEQRLTFDPAGTATMEVSLHFDRAMEDVVTLLEAYAQFSPEAEKFKGGVCAAAQRFAEADTTNKVPLQAKQFQSGDRFVCQFRINLGDPARLVTSDPKDPVEVTALFGKHRYRLSVDMSKIPDFSTEALAELSAALKEQFPHTLPEGGLAELWAKHLNAALAMTRILMPNRYVQFTVAAPRILDSNGTLAANGESVSFRLTFAEITALALDANARKDKKFFAVIEY